MSPNKDFEFDSPDAPIDSGHDPQLEGQYQDAGFALNETPDFKSPSPESGDSSGGFEVAESHSTNPLSGSDDFAFNAGASDGDTSDPISQLKKISEQSSVAQNLPVPYPFSLLITGHLTEREREKLVDVLTRENMGIREVELEPQFASGRILIPRISEYAGILLVQALRGTRAQLKLGPSDSIFATPETRDEPTDESLLPAPNEFARSITPEGKHPAETVRISADATIHDLPNPVLIDLVIVSTTLKSEMVEPRNSPKYQETLDALIRELKYRAHRKGAQAIINFSIDLTMLQLPSEYKLTVKGSAIQSAAEPSYY
jgi:hypothetical protein